MSIDPSQHPWTLAAEKMPLAPGPAMTKFDPVVLTDNKTGETSPHVLMTVATPSNVTSVFIAREFFENLIAQGNDIVNLWKSEDSPVILASVNDMKRETRAMNDLNGKLRP